MRRRQMGCWGSIREDYDPYFDSNCRKASYTTIPAEVLCSGRGVLDHGDGEAAVGVLLQKALRKAGGFFAEEEPIGGTVWRIPMVTHGKARSAEEIGCRWFPEQPRRSPRIHQHSGGNRCRHAGNPFRQKKPSGRTRCSSLPVTAQGAQCCRCFAGSPARQERPLIGVMSWVIR